MIRDLSAVSCTSPRYRTRCHALLLSAMASAYLPCFIFTLHGSRGKRIKVEWKFSVDRKSIKKKKNGDEGGDKKYAYCLRFQSTRRNKYQTVLSTKIQHFQTFSSDVCSRLGYTRVATINAFMKISLTVKSFQLPGHFSFSGHLYPRENERAHYFDHWLRFNEFQRIREVPTQEKKHWTIEGKQFPFLHLSNSFVTFLLFFFPRKIENESGACNE